MSVKEECISPPLKVGNRRRPGLREFDSLQDLLEQAGYKETRIFTPVAAKTPASPPQVSRESATPVEPISPSRDVEDLPEMPNRSSSAWFSTLWRAKDSGNHRRGALTRKQSEPVLSRKGRKAVQKNWLPFWDSSKGTSIKGHADEGLTSEHSAPPPVPPLPNPVCIAAPLSEAQPRPPLRHAPSTSQLWQGSMSHHRSRLAPSRSFPTRMREEPSSTLARKESYDGARAVAGVGFGAAKTTSSDLIFKGRGKQRISLRQAFGQDAEEAVGRTYNHTSRQEWKDSIGSLVDLQDSREEAIASEVKNCEQGKASPTTVPSLFSTAAMPILSRHDAVALRNVGCLDFAGMHDGHNPRDLRRMRSVDALELALARMERQQTIVSKAPSTLHSTIPESFSADSLTNDDFANAATTATTLFTETQDPDEQPIRRSSTPRLVITSPTGMRSPQPLLLEGREFEPRSVSPEHFRIVRPVANRQKGWKLSAVIGRADGVENAQRGRAVSSLDATIIPTNIPKRSSSRRRSRPGKGREHVDGGEMSLPPPALKASRKRTSKSCNDLRKNALASIENAVPAAGKLSGSEQIRALRRDVSKRSAMVANEPSPCAAIIPPSPSEADEDDPFRDFVAVAKGAVSATARPSSSQIIDRAGMSPIPFDHLQRRPLSASLRQPAGAKATEPTLASKTSGVGLACLVGSSRPRSPDCCDENSAPNPLLESPTAHIVKKRGSRSRLGQR